MNPTSTENSPPPSLEKSEEGQNQSLNKQLQGRMASEAVGPRKKPTKWADSVGMKFGKLEVLSIGERNKDHHLALRCKCDCGSIIDTSSLSLSHKKKSCGCLVREKSAARSALNRTHGHTAGGKNTKMYYTHQSMIIRCYGTGPQGVGYRKRGIKVCDRWRFGEGGKTGFECFLEDVPHTEDRSLSIDRINNDGDYTPENVRWADKTTQQNNTSHNRRLEHDGVIMTISKWGKLLGFGKGTLHYRLKSGYSVSEALTMPRFKRKK